MRVFFVALMLVAAAQARFFAQTPAPFPADADERMARGPAMAIAPDQQPRQPSPVAPREAAPARQPEPQQPRQAEAPARQPSPAAQPVNIRLEVTIADEGGGGDASKKVVTMILSDQASGSIRSSGSQRLDGPIPGQVGQGPVSINVDATPEILRDGMIRLTLGLNYVPLGTTGSAIEPGASGPTRGQLTQRLTVILADGKPLVISEAADAATNRRVTVTLTATVLK